MERQMGSTRVARRAVLVGQEEEAEIWLLLHRKAGKPPGHGQWDFKAAKAVRDAQATLQRLETSSPRKPNHSSWVHESGTLIQVLCCRHTAITAGRILSAMSS